MEDIEEHSANEMNEQQNLKVEDCDVLQSHLVEGYECDQMDFNAKIKIPSMDQDISCA